ncbi:MAG: histidine phosphatase family protein, partial [Gammaproteobacteria bacterium]|nr:histidine phosphatase family protein [Gammaproteobacteria bacterium]
MKTLTLVRHAKSSWKDTSLRDRNRPLNKRGKRDAPIMGQRIAAAGIRPSQIISSPAVRAWKTAKAVAMEIGYPAEFLQREEDLYLASLDTLLSVVAAQDSGFNNLML